MALNNVISYNNFTMHLREQIKKYHTNMDIFTAGAVNGCKEIKLPPPLMNVATFHFKLNSNVQSNRYLIAIEKAFVCKTKI